MESFKTVEHRHHTIKLYYDEEPHDGPREWDNLGTMTCFHSRYKLGDDHLMSVDVLQDLVEEPDVIALPLYLYDHSGISMRTNRSYPFDCPWDSGQVGFIWVRKQDVRREYNVKRISQKTLDRALSVLESEVDVYDQHLRGEVYGYVIEDEQGEHIDSCWGFYGNPDEYMVPEAMNIIDHMTKEQVGLIY